MWTLTFDLPCPTGITRADALGGLPMDRHKGGKFLTSSRAGNNVKARNKQTTVNVSWRSQLCMKVERDMEWDCRDRNA